MKKTKHPVHVSEILTGIKAQVGDKGLASLLWKLKVIHSQPRLALPLKSELFHG
jgi:hypothetical protein